MKHNSMTQPSVRLLLFSILIRKSSFDYGELIRLWSTLDRTESIQDFQSHKGIMKDLLNLRLSMTDYNQTNYRDVQGVQKNALSKFLRICYFGLFFHQFLPFWFFWLFLVISGHFGYFGLIWLFFVIFLLFLVIWVILVILVIFGYYCLFLVFMV